MRKKVIHYINLYTDECFQKVLFREASESSKIEYLTQALKASGYCIHMLSTRSTHVKRKLVKPRTITIDQGERHRYVFSFAGGRLVNKLNAVFNLLQILCYVLFSVRQNEPVLLYHQYYYYAVFTFLKRVKHFELILEIEELQYVLMHRREREELEFIHRADKYILIQSLLLQKVDVGNKPYLILYGDYRVPETEHKAFENDYINIVYAGVIESRSKGAFLACKAAEHLDSNFRVHILGFGNDAEIEHLRCLIDHINRCFGEKRVVYHGKKTGEDLSEFLNSCQIGLSCHYYSRADKGAEQYAFHSKIVRYLAHNLWVVSPRIACVTGSPFADFCACYSQNTPEKIPMLIAGCIRELVGKQTTAAIQPRQQLLTVRKEFETKLRNFIDA